MIRIALTLLISAICNSSMLLSSDSNDTIVTLFCSFEQIEKNGTITVNPGFHGVKEDVSVRPFIKNKVASYALEMTEFLDAVKLCQAYTEDLNSSSNSVQYRLTGLNGFNSDKVDVATDSDFKPVAAEIGSETMTFPQLVFASIVIADMDKKAAENQEWWDKRLSQNKQTYVSYFASVSKVVATGLGLTVFNNFWAPALYHGIAGRVFPWVCRATYGAFPHQMSFVAQWMIAAPAKVHLQAFAYNNAPKITLGVLGFSAGFKATVEKAMDMVIDSSFRSIDKLNDSQKELIVDEFIGFSENDDLIAFKVERSLPKPPNHVNFEDRTIDIDELERRLDDLKISDLQARLDALKLPELAEPIAVE